MKRCALYVRVSTDEQKKHGLSVDSQIVALRDYCKQNGLQEVGLYNDAGISARKSYKKRPALLQLIEDCERGLIDVILFTKLDRWFRSVADYYEVQTRLDACHVPWRAIWEDYETETSSGVFKVNIMLSVAQSEADRTSERVKAVNEYKRAQGGYVGSAPTGYMLQKKDLLIDPEQKDAVSLFFHTFLKTNSTRKSFILAKGNGMNCSYETARRMLHNPVYMGEAYGGYKCEPYLTQEEFENIQRISPLIERPAPAKEHRTYLFNGISRCGECGGIYCGTVRTLKCGSGKRKYKYYRCVSHQNLLCDNGRSITEPKIEKWLLDELSNLIAQYNADCTSVKADIADNTDQIKSLESRLRRIGDRYEDGDIDREEYRSKRDNIKKQIADLKQQEPEKRSPIELPKDWKEAYTSLDEPNRRLFWRSLIDHIDIFKDGSIKVTF